MTTTVFFAKNGAYFVRRTVTKEISPEEADHFAPEAHCGYVSPASFDFRVLSPEAAEAAAQAAAEAAAEAAQADAEEAKESNAFDGSQDVEAPPEAREAARQAMQEALDRGAAAAEAVAASVGAQLHSPYPPPPLSFIQDPMPGQLTGLGVPSLPVQKPQKRRVPLTSTLTERDDLLTLLKGVLEKQSPVNTARGMAAWASDPLNCNERIEIQRLDEGFCVTHHKPVDPSDLAEATRIEGDEWKGKGHMPGWVRGMLKLAGPRFMQAPVETYGFCQVDEVLEYVSDACDQARGRGWSPK